MKRSQHNPVISGVAHIGDLTMISHIRTGIVISLHHPTWKEDIRVWHKKGEPMSKKFHLDCSTKKILYTPFWDYRSILSVHFQEGGNKVRLISEKYVAISEDLLSSEVILQHNNTNPYRSKTITAFSWSIFLHPTNSPFRLLPLSKTEIIFGRQNSLQMRKS